jgi:hypothetical protein
LQTVQLAANGESLSPAIAVGSGFNDLLHRAIPRHYTTDSKNHATETYTFCTSELFTDRSIREKNHTVECG